MTSCTELVELTPIEWHILTYIQHFTKRWGRPPKLVDIKHGCALPNKQATRDVVTELEEKELVQCRFVQRHGNGGSTWYISLLPNGVVGVEP